jgi:arylsulfatase A-like enzyme
MVALVVATTSAHKLGRLAPSLQRSDSVVAACIDTRDRAAIEPVMHILIAIALASSVSFTTTSFTTAQSQPPKRPNIVVILGDDMGYSDLGCYGSEIETPNLDALAQKGLRFTQFYNGARCCPTRASLLTGLYAHQTGIGWMVDSEKGGPGYQNDLNPQCLTIAEVLRTAGYRNYMAGKWHVTPLPRKEVAAKHNWPLQRGFDRFYGTIHGAGSFWDPKSLARDNSFLSPFADDEYQPEDGFYYTDAISDHAVQFVREHHEQHGEQPFFLYLSYTAAHWPMQARERDIARYRNRYANGFGAIRAARFAKQKQLGVIQDDWPLSAASGAWQHVPDPAFEQRCMEVYAAMVDSMDQGVGRVVKSLRETGQFENTLILYLQDNGGCAESYGRDSKRLAVERAATPTLPPMAKDALQGDMVPKQTRDGYPVRQGYGVMPGAADTFVAYGREWANVSNTPFRLFKHFVHEGGISTPLIAHWPDGIKKADGFSKHGELRTQISHLIDIMATAIEVSGATYPKTRAGTTTLPPEGVSLVSAFADQPLRRSAPICFEHEGNRACRDGRWKVVARGRTGKWQLYDMQKDRVEVHDVASQYPDVTRRLVIAWEQWAERCHVIPWPHARAYVTPYPR